MNILVTLDRNYLQPLRVMLGSLYLNSPGETFEIYLVGDGLQAEDWADLERLCARLYPELVACSAYDMLTNADPAGEVQSVADVAHLDVSGLAGGKAERLVVCGILVVKRR